MKKFILLTALSILISSSFTSCRDKTEGNEEVLEEENEVFENEVTNDWGGEYDLNDDGLWDSEEFGDAYDEDWTTWDADGDGFLNDDEFYDTSYEWIDADDDDLLSEDEWNEGYKNLYGDYAGEEDFDVFDKDEDGFLNSDEWLEGWNDSDWFSDYDLDDDGLVDNDEWDDGLFGLWDENDDGYWDEEEYNTYTFYYDTW